MIIKNILNFELSVITYEKIEVADIDKTAEKIGFHI